MIRSGRIDPAQLAAAGIVRAYKQLKEAEKGFGGIKGPLEVRPIHHRLEDRVRAHLLICMLAEYVRWHLRHAWAACSSRTTTLAPTPTRSPRPPARRRRSATPPAAAPPAGALPHDREPLRRLENRTRNTIRVNGSEATFPQLSTPTELQARALALITEHVPQLT